MVKVDLVPVMQVDTVFPQCAEGFQRALNKVHGNMDVGYLYQECRNGGAYLFIAHNGENVVASMIVRFENWSGKSVLHTLGLWCDAPGTYEMMHQKQRELAKLGGAASLVSGARVSERGLCAYRRRHPTAKLLYVTLEVELD